ncbi:MAG: polyisoprenoid-binding protein YceI, partial [Myxococcota bacterium]
MMLRTLALTLALTLTACTDHTEGTVAAEVHDVAPEPATAPDATPQPTAQSTGLTAPEGAKLVKANGENSSLEWVGAKITKSHPGGFNTFTVEAIVADGSLTKVQTVIQISSMFSDTEKLTKHLLDDDFFASSRFGEVTFTSTAITAADGGHTITGVLDMHGIKKELSFPATVAVAPDGTATIDAQFNINRNDWNISYPGRPDDAIKDLVVIK